MEKKVSQYFQKVEDISVNSQPIYFKFLSGTNKGEDSCNIQTFFLLKCDFSNHKGIDSHCGKQKIQGKNNDHNFCQ